MMLKTTPLIQKNIFSIADYRRKPKGFKRSNLSTNGIIKKNLVNKNGIYSNIDENEKSNFLSTKKTEINQEEKLVDEEKAKEVLSQKELQPRIDKSRKYLVIKESHIRKKSSSYTFNVAFARSLPKKSGLTCGSVYINEDKIIWSANAVSRGSFDKDALEIYIELAKNQKEKENESGDDDIQWIENSTIFELLNLDEDEKQKQEQIEVETLNYIFKSENEEVNDQQIIKLKTY